ncbi:hypothetical protein JOH51_002524 [Rhizobium leguminosarum]|nr:hypothetical protein [Rhizobium leguminosarum]
MAFTEEGKLELESKYILDFERLLATRARRDYLLAVGRPTCCDETTLEHIFRN